MITKDTHIKKTIVTNHHVDITVQPEGTDDGYSQIRISVIPQKDGVLLHFNGLEGRVAIAVPSAANQTEVKFVVDLAK